MDSRTRCVSVNQLPKVSSPCVHAATTSCAAATACGQGTPKLAVLRYPGSGCQANSAAPAASWSCPEPSGRVSHSPTGVGAFLYRGSSGGVPPFDVGDRGLVRRHHSLDSGILAGKPAPVCTSSRGCAAARRRLSIEIQPIFVRSLKVLVLGSLVRGYCVDRSRRNSVRAESVRGLRLP